jgi:ABC-2 type transport system ATP-binding protein
VGVSANGDGYVVETFGLTKRFGERVAVDGVDLHIPRGVAFGYLGPNGAGKTTLIRMLLGLTAATAGTMRILGRDVPAERAEALARVGAIVEEPRFHGYLTGRQNLEVVAAARERESHGRIDAALERSGLADRADEKVRKYSLGMRQRLGVARSLLADPELLLLDEPTNGLDPAGIHAVRQTIRHLAYQGKTVLVSSHILAEVQQVADTVSIIGRGRLLAEGRVADLLASGGGAIRIRVPDPGVAQRLLAESGFGCAPTPDGAISVTTAPDGTPVDAGGLNRFLADRGVYASELIRVQADLEQVFLRLTAGEALGSVPSQAPPAVSPSAPAAPTATPSSVREDRR